MRMLYLQHQCMIHTAPPTQIVFTNDPLEMPKLLASASSCRSVWQTSTQGVQTSSQDVARDIPEWKAFSTPFIQIPTAGTVFCHRLTSPAGHVRLVGLDLVLVNISDTPVKFDVMTAATVLEAASAVTLPAQCTGMEGELVLTLNRGTTTVYAGQLDPADASHFTFVYRYGDQDTLVDGWLNDDDTVSLQRRRPGSPLTRPPMPPPATQPSRGGAR
jgi:hypothetical protein